MKPKRRWDSIESWLEERLPYANHDYLLKIAEYFIAEVDSDVIENIFGSEADLEGFYEPVCPRCEDYLTKEPRGLVCETCWLLWENEDDNDPAELCPDCLLEECDCDAISVD